ncbi:UV radiation resistance protein/autophagy-related protein 14, partial [Paraphysoderma sedebokerense]
INHTDRLVITIAIDYPQEKLNAAIGYAVHMLNLLALYLGIHLPFQLIYLGSKSYAKINYAKSIGDPNSQFPLYLTEDNFESFLFALAMLNYNVAYLCHTQGIEIPLQKTPQTLANLMSICKATELG